jgi:hypothetical protein
VGERRAENTISSRLSSTDPGRELLDAGGQKNITIRNGIIRGFLEGIRLEGAPAQGHLVEDIRSDHNYFVGIEVSGQGHLVRRNHVVATGGTTAFGRHNPGGVGIIAGATGTRVVDSDVITTVIGTNGGSDPAAIFISGGGGMAVNNRISDSKWGIVMEKASIKYRDNLTTGVIHPYDGGTSVGNNH